MASLEDFEDAAETPVATRPGGKIDMKDLPDGDYKFAVLGMAEKQIPGGRLLVEIAVEVVSDCPQDGAKLDQVYWLNRKDGSADDIAFGRLRKDLETLGFDTPEWKKSSGRSFSGEFKKACGVVRGVGFHGKKVTKNGYPNLYVNRRADDDGKPAKFGPEELAAGAEEDPFAS